MTKSEFKNRLFDILKPEYRTENYLNIAFDEQSDSYIEIPAIDTVDRRPHVIDF